jgi:hypothetical protein
MDDLDLIDLSARALPASLVDDEDSIELPPGAMSLEFLQAIYRSATQPMARRLKAASIAIQYESPKLAVTAVVTDDSLAARLNRAIERSAKVIELRAIEHQPTAPSNGANEPVVNGVSPAEVSTAAMRRPMPIISYRRR